MGSPNHRRLASTLGDERRLQSTPEGALPLHCFIFSSCWPNEGQALDRQEDRPEAYLEILLSLRSSHPDAHLHELRLSSPIGWMQAQLKGLPGYTWAPWGGHRHSLCLQIGKQLRAHCSPLRRSIKSNWLADWKQWLQSQSAWKDNLPGLQASGGAGGVQKTSDFKSLCLLIPKAKFKAKDWHNYFRTAQNGKPNNRGTAKLTGYILRFWKGL